jgi:hypothetical protein
MRGPLANFPNMRNFGAQKYTNCLPSQMQRDGADSPLVLFDIVKNEPTPGEALQRVAGYVGVRVAPSDPSGHLPRFAGEESLVRAFSLSSPVRSVGKVPNAVRRRGDARRHHHLYTDELHLARPCSSTHAKREIRCEVLRRRAQMHFRKWSRKSHPVFHPVTRGRCVHLKWQPQSRTRAQLVFRGIIGRERAGPPTPLDLDPHGPAVAGGRHVSETTVPDRDSSR